MLTELSENQLAAIHGGTYISEENKKFEEIRKNNLYKYKQNISLSNIKEELDKIKNGGISDKLKVFEAPVSLTIGTLCIELTLLPSIRDGLLPLELRFVIWSKKPNSVKWKVLEICLDDVNLDIEDNLIEEFAYNKLINYTKRNFITLDTEIKIN